MPTLGKTIFELSRIFRLLNIRFYNGELETPLIVVQTQGKHSAFGWCTTKRVWKDAADADRAYYEITMTAEYLTRSNEEIVATLLHEMVHLYCLQTGKKDTSRGNTYHNTTFKVSAESHGLTIEHVEKYGWTKTRLAPDALAYLPELKISRQAFRVARQNMAKQPSGSKPKSSSRKYECPQCSASVRATKEVSIICGICKLEMLAIG